MAFSKEPIAYAWRGAGQRWDSMVLQAIGGAIGGLLIWYWGVKVPPQILDNPALSGIAAIAIGAIVGVVLVFALRLLWWPLHKRLMAYDGLWSFLHRTLGSRTWPILLMGSGVIAFVVLFGTGAVLWAIQSVGSPHQVEAPANTATVADPLPSPVIAKAKNYFAPE
jgi:hypothetical protein